MSNKSDLCISIPLTLGFPHTSISATCINLFVHIVADNLIDVLLVRARHGNKAQLLFECNLEYCMGQAAFDAHASI